MSLYFPKSALVTLTLKCVMKVLKYNYYLLFTFTVMNKNVFVSYLYRAHVYIGRNTRNCLNVAQSKHNVSTL